MLDIGLPEIAIIALAAAVFFFGGEKLSDLARGLGRFTGEFKKGKADMENEIKKVKDEFKSESDSIKINRTPEQKK